MSTSTEYQDTDRLKPDVLAKKLGRHTNTVLRWARNNQLRSHRVNRRVIYFVWGEVREDMRAHSLKAGGLA